MASLVEADRPRRGWRQIDVTPADKGTAIVDPNRYASIVADADQRPKRKRAVRRRHCGTVEELTARSKVTTQAVAVDAGHFGVRRHASGKQRECNNSNFRLAGSPRPHGCTNGDDRSKQVLYARNGTGAGGQGLESGRHLLTLSRTAFGICIKWLTLSGSGLAGPILETEGIVSAGVTGPRVTWRRLCQYPCRQVRLVPHAVCRAQGFAAGLGRSRRRPRH